MEQVGILAYGSLVDDPGREIQRATIRRIEVETPFKVEFARSSRERDGAPTLTPVEDGGAQVPAVVLVLADNIELEEAASMLWRREKNRVGSAEEYRPPDPPGENSIVIKQLHDIHDVATVLYTWIAPNINPLTPEKLAELAIYSACAKAGAEGRDGISYLIAAKRNRIKTPLMVEYEREIWNGVPAKTLDEALAILRSPSKKPNQ